MKIHGPLVTLAAGALTGAALLAMSAAAARPQGATPARAAATATAPATAPATAAGAATVTAPATGAVPSDPATGTTAPPEPALTPAADDRPATGALAAYAGRLPGGRYALQLAVRGDRAVAYLCDGDQVEAWFRGTVSGSQVRLDAPDGGRLAATLRPGRARGGLDALGTQWSFSISAVDPASVKAVTAKVAP